jgi:hypothetical protein
MATMITTTITPTPLNSASLPRSSNGFAPWQRALERVVRERCGAGGLELNCSASKAARIEPVGRDRSK